MKFAADGALSWQRTWDGPGTFVDNRANDAAVAPDGSVYVVGSTLGANSDALLLKFSAIGTLLWQRAWGGGADERAQAVAVAGDGSVYVVGPTSSFGAGAEDIVILKLAPDGTLLWQKIWGTAENEEGQGVAVGADGNVYVAGVAPITDVEFTFGVVLLKIDPTGSLLLQRQYAGGNVTDARGGIAVATDGAVYAAGGLQEIVKNAAINDASLLKVTSDGGLVWDRTWGGDDFDFVDGGVAVAPDGKVVFVGTTDSFGQGFEDAFLLRLEPSGKTSDASTWGGAGFDRGAGVGVAPNGTVSLGATASNPPYLLAGAPTRTSRAKISVSTPAIALLDASGALSDPGGVVETPDGSTTYAGDFDAALVRIAP